MAQFTGAACIGDTSSVHTTQQNPLGMRNLDAAGNEYIYLQGIGSTIVGSWVTYAMSTYVTTLTVATSRGPVAVALAAVLASQFGWYMVRGLATGSVATGAAAANVWTTATPGRVDNTDVTLQLIQNASQVGATASNLATFAIAYPFCQLEVIN